ncbi:hypothetical protein Hdeb2414_s0009g00327181 [Helianthus debilis subsp. tardiflorus]
MWFYSTMVKGGYKFNVTPMLKVCKYILPQMGIHLMWTMWIGLKHYY